MNRTLESGLFFPANIDYLNQGKHVSGQMWYLFEAFEKVISKILSMPIKTVLNVFDLQTLLVELGERHPILNLPEF